MHSPTAAESMTRIMVMSETLPLAQVKARLSEIVDLVASQQQRVTITRHGRPAAVLVSPDDLESLEETLAIMSDPRLVDAIRAGRESFGRGDPGVPLEEIAAEHRERR